MLDEAIVVEVELVVDEPPEANENKDEDDNATVVSTTARTNLENNFICVFLISLFANLE